MSSILTNTSAMVALQTLRGVNQNLATTQDQISTGKKVGTAKDNAALWAISKVMESDVKGFRAIQENLSLGSSTVAVARKASETTTELLTEIKQKVVAAQEENVDRAKIQADISALREQIASVTGAAQFNGLNLVDNMRTETVLSSLDRSGGGVQASRIEVAAQDLTMRQQVFGTGGVRAGMIETAATDVAAADGAGVAGRDFSIGGTPDNGTASITFTLGSLGGDSLDPVTLSVDVSDTDTTGAVADRFRQAINENLTLQSLGVRVEGAGDAVNIRLEGEARMRGVDFSSAAGSSGVTGLPEAAGNIAANFGTFTLSDGTIRAGDSYRVQFGDEVFEYVANERDSRASITDAFVRQINESSQFFAVQGNDGEVRVTALTTDARNASNLAREINGTAGGGLSDLSRIDVADFSSLSGGPSGTTPFSQLSAAEQRELISASLENQLNQIEGLIQTSIDAAAAFGSVEKRIEIQQDFVGSLTDSLRAGIGTLVDADMEEASARLQALQVQQQLAIQSLSIANQAPQNILSLFR